MNRVGVIAGNGRLPLYFVQAAKKQGLEVVTISVTDQALVEPLAASSDEHYQISVGQLDNIITKLQDLNITEVVMNGKVNKDLMFSLELDQRMQQLLARLAAKNDDSILLALVDELEKVGIEVKEQTTYLTELLPHPGVLNDIEPSSKLIADMEFGFKMAKGIGKLDIGQTVVVKDQAVIAVEAIEGTDQTILRSQELADEVVVAKVSKPQQDFRFDIPTIGVETINNLIEVGACGIVIEADKTFVLDQSEVCQLANQAQIPIVVMR
ncbi:MAG: LpxI family protein [Bacillota bacterium]